MGRKKLEIKRIEDTSSRLVTFSKRRSGLIEKARQLSILCDVRIAALIFSNRGKLYHFCSADSLEAVLQQYHDSSVTEGRVSTGVYESENSNYASNRTSGELLQRAQRDFSDLNTDLLSVAELMQLEKEMLNTLFQIRTRQTQLEMDYKTSLHDKERLLLEENKHLKEQVLALEKGKAAKKKDFDLNKEVDMDSIS